MGDLASALKRTLEDAFGHVRLRGEISGFKRHSSGHCYFTLKDERACMDAVIWKGCAAMLRFRPEDGLEVVATGRLTTYPGSSKYQIVIEHLEPAGAGALMALLDKRRRQLAAEGLCRTFHLEHGLACVALRTSRFFPEDDDEPQARQRWSQDNLQANELLHRRVDLEDVVEAHRVALREAGRIGHGRFIVSATTPFLPEDCAALGRDAAAVLRLRVPGWEGIYARHGWTPPGTLDRVYDNRAAREVLGWQPRIDFAAALARLEATGELRSPLARLIGQKGYHRAG